MDQGDAFGHADFVGQAAVPLALLTPDAVATSWHVLGHARGGDVELTVRTQGPQALCRTGVEARLRLACVSMSFGPFARGCECLDGSEAGGRGARGGEQVEYAELTGVLRVHVHGARRLRLGKGGVAPNPYIKVRVSCAEGRWVTAQPT
jgi:hypothetical protein